MNKFILSVSLSVLLCACSDDTASRTDKPAQPQQQAVSASSVATAQTDDTAITIHNPNWPTYRVGTEATYPPFQYRNERGVPIGFEVELLEAVAKAGQFNTHIVHTSRKNWEQTLNNDKFAIWSSSFTLSPERQQVADFSQPFGTVENVVVVVDNEENRNVRSMNDLKGKKISVSRYSKTAPVIVGKLTGSAGNVLPSNTFYLALKDVYSGKADGVLGQDLVLAYYGKQHPNVKLKQINIGESKKSLAFAVKKGNAKLLQQLNTGLDKIKADGTYDALIKKWFGNLQK